MRKSDNNKNPNSSSSKPLKIEDLKSAMEITKRAMESLSQKTRVLPKVDKNGFSECPFAEDLYAEQEKALAHAIACLNNLRGYTPLIEEKINQWRHNLHRLRADGLNIKGAEARQEYRGAMFGATHQYQTAVQEKKELLELISLAGNTIAEARTKKYPGKKPEKKNCPALSFFNGDSSPYPAPTLLGVKGKAPSPDLTRNKELTDLISLGPLSRKPFQ